MSAALLPCPWCGHKAYEDSLRRNGLYCVMCEWCEAEAPGGDMRTEDEAIAAWNTRWPDKEPRP